MKVLVTLDIPEVGINMLREAGLQVTVSDRGIPMGAADLSEAAKSHDILLSVSPDKLDAAFLDRHRHLKMISQFAAGYDNIDTGRASGLGIIVANAPGAMVEATADIAFALMLAVTRKLFFMHRKIGAGEWGPFQPRAHLGMELKGKTLGIFGLGLIGSAMARRCAGAYGMKILYHNRRPNPVAEAEFGASYVSFEALLAGSDVISVHAALTPETAGLFNREAFGRMKPTAIFLNTARGGIHNEEHLIEALRNKAIWGAGLDVTNPEPMVPGNPLLQMENVAVTPHIGSATVEARNEMSRLAAENILQYIRGEAIANRVV